MSLPLLFSIYLPVCGVNCSFAGFFSPFLFSTGSIFFFNSSFGFLKSWTITPKFKTEVLFMLQFHSLDSSCVFFCFFLFFFVFWRELPSPLWASWIFFSPRLGWQGPSLTHSASWGPSPQPDRASWGPSSWVGFSFCVWGFEAAGGPLGLGVHGPDEQAAVQARG